MNSSGVTDGGRDSFFLPLLSISNGRGLVVSEWTAHLHQTEWQYSAFPQ